MINNAVYKGREAVYRFQGICCQDIYGVPGLHCLFPSFSHVQCPKG